MPEQLDAIVIGAGISGLLAACKIKKSGLRKVAILERSSDLGGTWNDNIYPGSGCDVPGHLYSYEDWADRDWRETYSSQAGIQRYLRSYAEKHELYRNIAFDTEATRAQFDTRTATWEVTTLGGRKWRAPIFVLATGQLNSPKLPDIPGIDSFAGHQFHSARWNYNVDLRGKTVACIGCGASAVQFIPEIQPKLRKLVVFQRSPNWILPRRNKEYGGFARFAMRHVPGVRRGLRALTFRALEKNHKIVARPDGLRARAVKRKAQKHMRSQVRDLHLRDILTPDHSVGCKRILLSDDYYPAVDQPNVTVVTSPIKAIEPNGVRLKGGSIVHCDVLIWATGFQTHNFVAPLNVQGLDGRTLAGEWADGAEAYRGTTVAGFPNMFVLYGPNTNLAHNSMVYMVEQQVDYMMQAIRRLRGGRPRFLTVKPEVQRAFNEELKEKLGKSAWATGCTSWYRQADGKIPNNWADTARRFRRDMKRFDEDAYDMVPAG